MLEPTGGSLTTLSDAALLQRFREGDVDSFEVLFERHYDRIYGVLFRLTGTRAQAEDLAQEVFLKLYQRPLQRGANVSGWLYRVALNTGYNALRGAQRRSRREQVAAEDLPHPPTPEDEVARREARRSVRTALAAIPPRSAKLLVLRELGLSYREMADAVGVKASSVGTLLVRAQRSFEAAYTATHDEAGEADG